MRKKRETLHNPLKKQIRKAIIVFLVMVVIAVSYQMKHCVDKNVTTKIKRGAIQEYQVTIGQETFDVTLHPSLGNDNEGTSDILSFEKENVERKFNRFLREMEEDDISQDFCLPKEFEGKKVTWKVKKDYTFILLLFLGGFMSALILGEPAWEKKKAENKKKELLMMQYPQLVEVITILMGAGMSLRQALKEITAENQLQNGPLRTKLQAIVDKVKAGQSMVTALTEFADSCNSHTYRKFVGLLLQNQEKGTEGLAGILELEVQESELMRLSLVKEKAQKAETKILIPMTMLLMVVVAILMAPAFIGMKG